MNKDVFFSKSEPVAETARWEAMPVLDMGLQTRCAWASAKTLIEQLIEERGVVSFGEWVFGGQKLSTLDLFLDDPVRLKTPRVKKISGGEIHSFADANMAVGLFSQMPMPEPGQSKHGFMIVTKDTGVVAAVYRSYLKTVESVQEILAAGFLDEQVLWGWSTILLPPLCDDAALFGKRLQTAAEDGSIISLWVRADSDAEIKGRMRTLSKRGELRLQNLKTANTFLLGDIDEAVCKKAFGL
jgi:hypothetical protein